MDGTMEDIVHLRLEGGQRAKSLVQARDHTIRRVRDLQYLNSALVHENKRAGASLQTARKLAEEHRYNILSLKSLLEKEVCTAVISVMTIDTESLGVNNTNSNIDQLVTKIESTNRKYFDELSRIELLESKIDANQSIINAKKIEIKTFEVKIRDIKREIVECSRSLERSIKNTTVLTTWFESPSTAQEKLWMTCRMRVVVTDTTKLYYHIVEYVRVTDKTTDAPKPVWYKIREPESGVLRTDKKVSESTAKHLNTLADKYSYEANNK